MKTINISFVFFIACLLLACGRSKEGNYYVLNPLPMGKNNKLSSLTIGIDDIKTPAYLDRLQLLLHNSAHRIQLEENSEWIEALPKNIARVIRTNLATLLPGAVIENAPWDVKFKPTYHLQIDISEFKIDRLGNSSLRAEWIIYRDDQLIEKYDNYYHHFIAEPTTENLVTAMNNNLAYLTRDIAKTIVYKR